VRLGALYQPSPPEVPLLRAAAALPEPIPETCDWYRRLDLTDDAGQPDTLGNDVYSNCVEVAALRLTQLWAGDRRKPTQDQALALLDDWGGDRHLGTLTDQAFGRWCRNGIPWGDQRLVVPRWSTLENDGVAINLGQLKRAIYYLGGVLAVFDMPQIAMNYERWELPVSGSEGSASAGAHCVLLGGYNPGNFWASPSWGRVIPVSYSFVLGRMLHASAFAAPIWVQPDGQGGARTPSGLSLEELQSIGISLVGT